MRSTAACSLISITEGDFDCTASSGQSIDCDLANLDAGATKSITVTYHVAANTAAASVDNTASATADDGGADDDTDTIDIETKADLADLKTAATTVIAGNSLTYTITITNNGPSDALAVSVLDTLDASLTDTSWTLDTVAQVGAWPGLVLLGTMTPGQVHTIVISATVDPSTPEGYDIENTASAATSTDDPNTANNVSETTTTVETEADLTITKSGPATATAGDPAGFDYTITVSNDGPSDNSGGFSVSDTLATGLTFEATGSDPRCSATGQDVTCANTSGLAADADDTFTVHVTLDLTIEAGVVLENTATVASDGTLDPNSANDTSNTVETTVEEDVQLSVVKTFNSATVTAGGATSGFTITVTNNGVSEADNVNLTDTVDGRLIVGLIAEGAFNCSASSAQTITCTLANLDAGATATLTVAYDVDAATEADPAVDNTLRPPPMTARHDDTTSVAIVEDVVLDVTKTFDDATVTAGGAASGFTITVKNTGVSQADNVNLTDTVDGRLIVGTVTGDFSCTDPDTDAQTITCTLANLDAGATATLTVAYDVDTATEADPVVDNTASGPRPTTAAATTTRPASRSSRTSRSS